MNTPVQVLAVGFLLLFSKRCSSTAHIVARCDEQDGDDWLDENGIARRFGAGQIV
jgi:hypothetical protein